MLNGLVLCYFVLSSLNTIRKPANCINLFDKVLLGFAFILTIAFAWYAYQTTQVYGGKLGGFGIQAYIAFGSVMFFSTIADINYIKMGGLSGKKQTNQTLVANVLPVIHVYGCIFPWSIQALTRGASEYRISTIPGRFGNIICCLLGC